MLSSKRGLSRYFMQALENIAFDSVASWILLCLYSTEAHCDKYKFLLVKLVQPFAFGFSEMFFILF